MCIVSTALSLYFIHTSCRSGSDRFARRGYVWLSVSLSFCLRTSPHVSFTFPLCYVNANLLLVLRTVVIAKGKIDYDSDDDRDAMIAMMLHAGSLSLLLFTWSWLLSIAVLDVRIQAVSLKILASGNFVCVPITRFTHFVSGLI